MTLRVSRRLFALLVLVLLQAAVLAAQPALTAYHARMKTFSAQIPAVVASAQQAAETMLAHPDALLNVPYWEQMGFAEELMNRAGGLAHVYPTGWGWGRTATKHDVVLLSVRAWETQADLIRARVQEYRAQGWTVTLIGSKAGKPKDLGEHFFIDNGAPSGKAEHGRINVLANVTLGWMWCCEYGAAMSRRGKFPAVLQSICIPGGEAYDRTIQSTDGRRSVVDCPTAVPAGALSRQYLQRMGVLLADLRSTRRQQQLRAVAGLLTDRLAQGGRVGMVGMGHLILEEVKVENKTPWIGFRAVGISDISIKSYLRPGDLLVWMSYNGMNSLYEDYAKNIVTAQVDLVTCFAFDPEWSKNTPPALAHLDQSWKLPDAEVPIPVFPDFMAPVSGLNVTLLLRMLDDETAVQMKKRKVSARAPQIELPADFIDRMGESRYAEDSPYGGPLPVRKWGLVNQAGEEVAPPRYDEIGSMEDGLAPVRRDGKWGYVDAAGAETIAPAYDAASPFRGGLATVGVHGKFGCIDTAGAVVLPLQYEAVETGNLPTPGYLMVRMGGKWGITDRTGKELLAPRYDGVDVFSADKVIVKVGNKFGVVTTAGAEVLPVRYETIWGVFEGVARVRLDGKWGLVDAAGKELLPPSFDRVSGPFGKMLLVRQAGKWGAIGLDGRELIPPTYTRLRYYSDGLLLMAVGEKWGALNTDGREIIPPQYDDIQRPGDGMVGVKRGGKWGYLDSDGREALPAIYDEAQSFQGGVAVVTLAGRRLFIDKAGKEITLPRYDYFAAAEEGLFKVVRDGKWGFIDATGREIVPPSYRYVLAFSGKYALVARGGAWTPPVGLTPELTGARWGLVDTTGREVVPPKYDRIVPHSDTLFAVGIDVKQVEAQP